MLSSQRIAFNRKDLERAELEERHHLEMRELQEEHGLSWKRIGELSTELERLG